MNLTKKPFQWHCRKMQVVLNLSESAASTLAHEAKRKGVSLETVIDALVTKNLSNDSSRHLEKTLTKMLGDSASKDQEFTPQRREKFDFPYQRLDDFEYTDKAKLAKRRLAFIEEGPRDFDVEVPRDYPPRERELF